MEWTRLRLTGNRPPSEQGRRRGTVPREAEPVSLYCVPKKPGRVRLCDVGRVYVPEDGRVRRGRRRLYWQSAAGVGSALDGLALSVLCREYKVWFSPAASFTTLDEYPWKE